MQSKRLIFRGKVELPAGMIFNRKQKTFVYEGEEYNGVGMWFTQSPTSQYVMLVPEVLVINRENEISAYQQILIFSQQGDGNLYRFELRVSVPLDFKVEDELFFGFLKGTAGRYIVPVQYSLEQKIETEYFGTLGMSKRDIIDEDPENVVESLKIYGIERKSKEQIGKQFGVQYIKTLIEEVYDSNNYVDVEHSALEGITADAYAQYLMQRVTVLKTVSKDLDEDLAQELAENNYSAEDFSYLTQFGIAVNQIANLLESIELVSGSAEAREEFISKFANRSVKTRQDAESKSSTEEQAFLFYVSGMYADAFLELDELVNFHNSIEATDINNEEARAIVADVFDTAKFEKPESEDAIMDIVALDEEVSEDETSDYEKRKNADKINAKLSLQGNTIDGVNIEANDIIAIWGKNSNGAFSGIVRVIEAAANTLTVYWYGMDLTVSFDECWGFILYEDNSMEEVFNAISNDELVAAIREFHPEF